MTPHDRTTPYRAPQRRGVSTAASRRRRTARRAAPLFAAGVLLLAGGAAFAQTDTYNGTSLTFTNGFTGSNATPVSGDALSFGAAGNAAIVNDLANLTIGPGVVGGAFTDAIDFTAGAPSYTLSGNDFILGGNIVNTSGVLQTINMNYTEVGGGNPPYGLTYDTGVGGITLGGNLDADSTGTAGAVTYDLDKSGTGTLTLAGSVSHTNSFVDNVGTVVLGSGGTLTNNFFTQIGTTPGQSATLTLQGSSVFNDLNGSNGPTGFDVGIGPNTAVADPTNPAAVITATVNVNGTSQLNIGSGFHIGNDTNTVGTVNINGGTLTTSGTALTSIGSGYSGPSTGSLNVASGSFLNGNNGLFIVGDYGTGTLTISGTGLVNTEGGEGVRIGAQSLAGAAVGAGIGDGTVNLDGGTLLTNAIIKHSFGGSDAAVGALNLNGGTLEANADNANFIDTSATDPLQINVRDGGAVIDTNGHAITIGAALTHSGIAGDAADDGGLTKNGAGTLTLSGANTYTGATTVNGGTLAVSSSAAIPTGSALALNNGSTLNAGGSSLTFGSLAEDPAFLDFGPLGTANSLTFADSTGQAWTGALSVLDFETADSLIFGGVTDAQLADIQFVNPGGFAAGTYGAQRLGGGQIAVAAAPEPSQYAALGLGVFGLAGLALKARKRKGVTG